MPVISFFKAGKPLTINEIAALSGVTYTGSSGSQPFAAVSSIKAARPGDVTFATGTKQRDDLSKLDGVLLFCPPALTGLVPISCFVLETDHPSLAFNRFARALYPEATRSPLFEVCSPNEVGAFVHPTAKLEDGVSLSAGCVIGANVEIGRGTRVGPGVSIAAGSTIGRNCDLGARAAIQCAHIGDDVVIGPLTSIGHDGFGYVPGPTGLEKVPQIGRVIIQNKVEVGANSCIDRGSLGDTTIGEGTKIDNLVQIAHNVQIGRNCVLAGLVGVSGSVTIGHGVMIGGRAGIVDHSQIGDGAVILGASGVTGVVPAGARYGGTPAQPSKDWFRGIFTLQKLSSRGKVSE